MGHEFSETISAIGDGISDLMIEENIVIEPYFVCDECAPRGAERITVIISEPSAVRKEKVLSTGVPHHVIDSTRREITARVMGFTNGVGANVAFECTSINAALDQLTDEGFDSLISYKESAVKIIARPEVTDVP
ncbi:MAG: hypothetical protein H7279_00965 [Microbacteriaceae bacterium]|nr:hypothetical protein [Microbacteriaceae bacterium]